MISVIKRGSFGLLAALVVSCGNIEDLSYADCPVPGAFGCACDATGGCQRLEDGTALICGADNLCARPNCEGSEGPELGCVCGAGGQCAEGLVCSNGNCVVDTGQTLVRPANPKCYTPCKADLVEGGQVRTCSADGLIEGCIDGALCRAGSCVLPVSGKPSESVAATAQGAACSSDSDCPSFQSCIENACFSECDVDTECREGRRCVRHACRLPCAAAQDTCPDNTVCETVDGDVGFCQPVAGVGAPGPEFTGAFSVSVTRLAFSADAATRSFVLQNDGATALELTLRKAKHTEYADNGPKLITEQPLSWLRLGEVEADTTQTQELVVSLPPGASKTVYLTHAQNPALSRYDGELQILHPRLRVQSITLSYTGTLEGKWSGNMYFFANFGDRGLETWRSNPDDQSALRAVGNALIRRWGAFRDRRISLDEFKATITATQTESWKWNSVKDRCPTTDAPDPNVGCYLYDNVTGLGIYSDFLPDNPIPTGASALPISVNLQRDGAGSVLDWTGRIVSEEALQYAGSPRVSVRFAEDPSDCSTSAGRTCINRLRAFSADIYVGGRYLTQPTDTTCAQAAPDTFQLTSTPWLVPGFGPNFTARSNEVLGSGPKFRYECRDKLLPFSDPSRTSLNINLAVSNPVPDGSTRKRTLELLDGALIDQNTLFVLVRERFPSFLDPADTQGFSAYGYMLLERTPARLAAADFQSTTPQDYRAPASRVLNVSCSPELLTQVNVSSLDSSNAARVGQAMVDGVIPSATPPATIDPNDPSPTAERVHYLCAATGLFDGGKLDDGTASASRVSCPAGSQVRFFTLSGAGSSQQEVAEMSCQNGGGICREGEPCSTATVTADGSTIPAPCTAGSACSVKGTCGELFQTWLTSRPANVRLEPVFRCTDSSQALCDVDRTNLRAGKTFYKDLPQQVVFRGLDELINEAFRYKTQFQNRSGTGLGFVPQTCSGGAGEASYCYDPEQIEQIRDRVDCATHVYTEYYAALGSSSEGQAARALLKAFLGRNYSYFAETVPGLPAPVIHDGFERLNAELLIMLGDESYTSSFASRFDLAGQQLADFQGALFEPNGINLSGGAGFEMYSLYQSVQYYQMALDRFYRLSGAIWSSFGRLPPGQGFVTPQTATSYFARLIRASSQKSRAWSQVSKRYQAFNRPDLARLVVSRAYTSAYLESVLLSRMMQRLIDSADAADRAQIVAQLELAQQTYQAAMMEMANVYRNISDNITYFGFQPDYVPFPALNPLETNAFDKALARAQAALATAAEKEAIALADNRTFDTDAASFQSALAQLTSQYEDELANLCGTFQVNLEGQPQVFPAISKYAYLDRRASAFGDPCGLMGNGELYDAVIGLEQKQLEIAQVKQAHQNLLGQVNDVLGRASEQCGRIATAKDFYIRNQDKILSLQDGINSLELVIDAAERAEHMAEVIGDYVKCTVGVATDCPTAFVASGAYVAVASVTTGVAVVSQAIITGLEAAIGDTEKAIVLNEMEQECSALNIDAKYEVKGLYRETLQLQLDALKAQYELQLALSNIQKLRNQAIYLASGQQEESAHLINIEAARNDPNVRIYRNDAIVTADQTFFRALQEAYKATKVFEYYTSQSYAPLQNLVLVRMVSHGDFTLESYLAELDSAFQSFQEQFGLPDTRVAIVSVRDDVLRIPELGDNGVALPTEDRIARFRAKLQDATLLDGNGYVTLPFTTTVDSLSPLTRNHKILGMEVELVGRGVGDDLGRVYVRQSGTSTVLTVEGEKSFYAFPERLAVMNPFFNGTKPLAEAIYWSERLRDRPYLNTGWELVLNRKDESVNRDIRLDAIDDIKLYVYYTDFTQL